MMRVLEEPKCIIKILIWSIMSAKKLPVAVNNIQQIPQSLSMSRYLSEEAPPSPDAFPLTQKMESPERPTYTSQLRQSNMMKRYKVQKNVESKIISVTTYNQNHDFLVGPAHSQCLQPNPMTFGKMMPFNNSSWVNNTKKIQKRWMAEKRGESADVVASPKKQRPIKPFYQSNDICQSDLRDYFQSMKHYFNGIFDPRQTKLGLNIPIKALEEENRENLTIRPLKPSTPIRQAKPRRNTLEHTEQDEKDDEMQLSPPKQYRSTNFITKVSPNKRALPPRTSHATREKRPLSKPEVGTIFRRKPLAKKEDFHYTFGNFKSVFNEEDALKLRNLYYRDLLWKISFNRGYMFEMPSPTPAKFSYYMGKGNNSRLVRRILGRRGWWVEESKPENATFIWTQLKIYDLYKHQTSMKDQVKARQNQFEQQLYKEEQLTSETPEEGDRVKQNILTDGTRDDKNRYLMNKDKYLAWRKYIKARNGQQRKPPEDMSHRKFAQLTTRKMPNKITNHLELSRVIGNKKALYRTMEAYFAFTETESYLPLTFHITGGLQDDEYLRFLRDYYRMSKEGLNCWIVKPGELSNRGRHIKFCKTLPDIKKEIKQRKTNANGSLRTYIVQSYIDRPLLYQGRKFDLRHYLMITSTQGTIRGYFYQEGYVRTTSQNYSITNPQPGVHLTNDAVQKYLPNYGKFQKGNKLSYRQLNEYMLRLNPKKGFYDVVYPKIRNISREVIEAAFPFIDPQRRSSNFEIFGIDVMIDANYKCWLIEVNTNPCIEVSCKVLADVVPHMLDNAFAITLDSVVTPPAQKLKSPHENALQWNKFELVFDEQVQGQALLQHYTRNKVDIGNYGDDDENYESCDEGDWDK